MRALRTGGSGPSGSGLLRTACRGSATALVAVLAAALVSCGGGGGGAGSTGTTATVAAVPNPKGAGRLVSAERLTTASETEVRALLDGAKLPSDNARSGATAYRLAYRTVDAEGAATTATGLVVLPRDLDGPLPTILYEHGTVVRAADAPSELTSFEGRAVSSLLASGGFVVAAPDYLGLGRGDGRGEHPYLHAGTEVTASRDLLRALRAFAGREGVELSGELFVTGFSQGGQAAMAFAEQASRQRSTTAGMELKAVAPVAGPLDLVGSVWPALFQTGRRADPASVAYLAQVLVAWNRLYGLYDDPGEIFAAPYAETVEQLFDGTRTDDEVAAALPGTVAELLRPEALASLRRQQGPVRRALSANAVCRAAPDVPVRIYQASRDRVVVPANGRRCRARLSAQGGDVELLDVGPFDHVGAAYQGLPDAEQWFRSLAGEQSP